MSWEQIYCQTDDRWWMTDDGWRMTDDRWQMTDDGWQMTDDGWRMTDDGWQMMDEGWRMTPLVLQILFQKTLNDTKINSASYIKDMTLNTKHKQFNIIQYDLFISYYNKCKSAFNQDLPYHRNWQLSAICIVVAKLVNVFNCLKWTKKIASLESSSINCNFLDILAIPEQESLSCF